MSHTICESDLPELSGLLSAALPHHPVNERQLRRRLLGQPGYDPALTRVEKSAGGNIESLVAALLPEQLSSDGRRQARLVALATRPESQRRGLARQLYAEVEGELRRRGVQDVMVGDGLVPSGLDLRYRAAVTMLLRRLYVPTDVGYDQTLDPEAAVPPATPPPAGFQVRLLSTADAPALEDLCAAEFPGWKGTARLIAAGPGCGVEGAFDAKSGKLAAFAGFAEYVFGPTGTAREYRRRGLGTAVFWPAVRELREFSPDVPVLIGRANISFYARAFGCHIRGTVWHMRKNLDLDPAISKGKSREEA
jgi:predicted N-acetyltransferase YhbS